MNERVYLPTNNGIYNILIAQPHAHVWTFFEYTNEIIEVRRRQNSFIFCAMNRRINNKLNNKLFFHMDVINLTTIIVT